MLFGPKLALNMGENPSRSGNSWQPSVALDVRLAAGQSGMMAKSPKSTPLSQAVVAKLVGELDSHLAGGERSASAVAKAKETLTPDVLARADAVLQSRKGLSYRDGLLIQLGWGLAASDPVDHTQRGAGGRSTAQALGAALKARHIAGVNDAYENIAKNHPNLVRGNLAEFDDLLLWMNRANPGERNVLLDYLLARVAELARPVRPMPTLARTELTFAKVTAFLDDLLSTPSGGAYEQFAAAAFLKATIEQFGLSGVGALDVRTKRLTASDASSGSAADVQIVRGNMIEEVFEVSANDWKSKVPQAVQAARVADLPRAHILAANGGSTLDLARLLGSSTTDVSVIDIRSLLRVIVAVLKKPAREEALRHLYDLTDRLQPDIQRTNTMVELLGRHALTA